MSTLKPTDLAVIIPAFNEARTIKRIVEQSLQHSPHVIVVDDGSTDETVAMLEGLPVTLIRNNENKGKGFSLLVGFAEALEKSVEAVITLDADGQHNPEDIGRLAKAGAQYPDHFIIGARLRNQQFSPRYRLRANKVADFFISLAAKAWVQDTQSGFRLYPANFLKQLDLAAHQNKRFVLESRIVIEAAHRGYPIAMLPIDAYYPEGARGSHYKWLVDTLHIALMISQQFLKRGFEFQRVYKMLREKDQHPMKILENLEE